MTKKRKQNRKRQQSESERDEKVEGKCSHIKDAVKITTLTNKIPHEDLTTCQYCENAIFNELDQINNAEDKNTTIPGDELGEVGGEVPELAAELSSALCVCLKCCFVGCSRQSKYKHALAHFKAGKAHSVVVSVLNWMVWCYQCDKELDPELNTELKPCLALLKKVLGVKESDTNEVVVDKKKKSNAGLCEKVVGIKGLTNLGNTCFFNSVMQNLCQIHLLRLAMKYLMMGEFEYRVQPPEQNLAPLPVVVSGKYGPLTSSLVKFLEDMTEDSKKHVVNPGNLFSEICKKAPRFKGFRQQDSQELLRYLLDAVRTEEIKTVKSGILSAFDVKKITGKEGGLGDIVGSETHDKIRAYGRSACAPVIDSLFGGILVSSVECLMCFKVFTIKESFFDLSLSLAANNPTVTNNKSKNTTTAKKEAPPRVSEKKTRGKPTPKTEEKPKTERPLSKHQQKKKAKAAKKEMKNKRRHRSSVSKSESHDTEPQDEKAPVEDEAPANDFATTAVDLPQDQENRVACDQTVVTDGNETVSCPTEEQIPAINEILEDDIPQVDQPVSSQAEGENAVSRLAEQTSDDGKLQDKQETSGINELNSGLENPSVPSNDATHVDNKLGRQNTTTDKQPMDTEDSNMAGSTNETMLEVAGRNTRDDNVFHNGETNSNTDNGQEKDISEICVGSQRLSISDQQDIGDISPEINKSHSSESMEPETGGKTDDVCTEGSDKITISSRIEGVNSPQGSLDCPINRELETSEENNTKPCLGRRDVDEHGTMLPGSNELVDQVSGTNCGGGKVEGGGCVHNNQPDTNNDDSSHHGGSSCNDNQEVAGGGDVVIAGSSNDNAAKDGDGSIDSGSSGCGDSGFGGSSGDGTDNSADSGMTNGDVDNVKHSDSHNENTNGGPITTATSEILSWNHSLKPMNATKYDTASVEECLKRFCTPEVLAGDNSFICEHCNKRNDLEEESDEEDSESGDEDGSDHEKKKAKKSIFTEAVKQMLIHQPPPILTLHLKRFHQVMYSLRKLPKHIDFPVTLDIAPFCHRSSQVTTDSRGGVLYSLCGVVEHSGSLHSGHYTAYCRLAKPSANFFPNSCKNLTEFLDAMKAMWARDSEDGSLLTHEEQGACKWYYISDSHVSGVTEEKVLKAQAYLLFYQRMALVQGNNNAGNDKLPAKES